MPPVVVTEIKYLPWQPSMKPAKLFTRVGHRNVLLRLLYLSSSEKLFLSRQVQKWWSLFLFLLFIHKRFTRQFSWKWGRTLSEYFFKKKFVQLKLSHRLFGVWKRFHTISTVKFGFVILFTRLQIGTRSLSTAKKVEKVSFHGGFQAQMRGNRLL